MQVKMLCSSGGHFIKLSGGGWEYTGGETRLVSVSSDCHMQELQDALHRVSQTMRLDLSSSSASVRSYTPHVDGLHTCLLLRNARLLPLWDLMQLGSAACVTQSDALD